MACPEPITPLNEGTSNQSTTKSIIEGHVSALKELLKEPSNRDLIKPRLLDFDDIQDVSDEEIKGNVKEKAKVGDEDLSKPFKEVVKCPFTRRIVEFSSPGHKMPANAKIYDGTDDPEDHVGRFVGIENQGEWPMPLAKRFSDNVPKTVDEMLKRADDYLRSEEAFRSTELPGASFSRKRYWYSGCSEMIGTNVSLMGTTAASKNINLLLKHQSAMPHMYHRNVRIKSSADQEKIEQS
ncbi:hypothetical protein Tco_0790270 [Tanacetum coccineum]